MPKKLALQTVKSKTCEIRVRNVNMVKKKVKLPKVVKKLGKHPIKSGYLDQKSRKKITFV